MRRNKARVVGLLLLPAGALKVVAAGVALTMVVGVAGDTVLGGWIGEGYRTVHGPGQRWGSAADGGGRHFEGRPANRTLPDTVRGRYPKQVWDQRADQTVTEAEAPVAEHRGFDANTSKEVTEARNANERVYNNNDGTQTTEFSAARLNYRGKDGTWTPIDPKLVADPGQGWRNAADEVGLRFAARTDSPDLVSFAADADHALSYTMSGIANSAPVVDGETITYPRVLPGVDLKLESQPGGVKETLVLAGADVPTAFMFPLRLKGLKPAIVDGQVVFTDTSGARRAVIPPGDMVDANGAVSTAVEYRLDGNVLELRVDAAWLKAPGRAFPVAVDPTIKLPVTGESADTAMYTSGGGFVNGERELHVGSGTSSYVKFGDLVSRLHNHTIFGAQLWAVNYDAESCSPRPVSVHPVTGSWGTMAAALPGSGGRRRARQQVLRARLHRVRPALLGLPQTRVSSSTSAWVGRDLVQGWVDDEQPNHGLSLRVDGGGEPRSSPAPPRPTRRSCT